MAVPTTISDLSATAASNSPASGDSPAEGDDFFRAHGAFIRQIHDGDLTDYVKVTSDGRLYGTALHNNAGAVTGTTNQYIASGTYTPSLTNTTNVAASSANTCQWMRVGNVVTVSGSLSIDPTAASTVTELDLSLPIASAMTSATHLAGSAVRSSSVAAVPAQVLANPTADTAQISYFNDTDVANRTWRFTFTYVVL